MVTPKASLLEILEYCTKENAISREQYYLDLLNPEYNILKTAGSPLGLKHTKEALAKMRGRKLSKETIAKMVTAKKGINHPIFGKTHSQEIIDKMSAAKQGEKNPMFGKTRPELAGKPSQKKLRFF
jgi:group I intron endonuclease